MSRKYKKSKVQKNTSLAIIEKAVDPEKQGRMKAFALDSVRQRFISKEKD
jgi:hypothetical protein